MKFGPWIYDERAGMVAVYSGPERNCLDLPDDCFVYVRHWEKKADGQGWEQIEEEKEIGKLIAKAPEMAQRIAELEAQLGELRPIVDAAVGFVKAHGSDMRLGEQYRSLFSVAGTFYLKQTGVTT